MATELFANNFSVQLTSGVLVGDSTISVSAAAPSGLQGGQFRILIDQEYMIVTAGQSSTTWTVTRAVENTTAAAHQSGNWVTHLLTSGGLGNAPIGIGQLPSSALKVSRGSTSAPSIYFDPDPTTNSGASPNLAIGSLFPNIVSSTTTGFSNTAIGAGWSLSSPRLGNLGSITTGSDNVAIGAGVLISETTGTQNVAVGNDSLARQVGASNNTAIGQSAGTSVTTGSQNTILGASALNAETTGSFNTALGYFALGAQVGISGNTAVGYQALRAATAGPNDALGHNALSVLTSGAGNVAVGYNSLVSVTTSSNNTAVGNLAAGYPTGAANTAVGFSALLGTPASATHDNTAIGYQALLGINGGVANTAVGSRAVESLTAGDANTVVGAGLAGSALVNGGYNTIIGAGAGHTGTTDHYFMTLLGQATAGSADGVVAIGSDHTGTSATATVQDAFVLGTSAHAVSIPGTLQVTGNIGFFGHALTARSAAYTLNAGATSRNLASGGTVANVEQVLRQLITDLQGYGLLQ